MDLVLYSNSKDYWTSYGYLLGKTKSKYTVIPTDLYSNDMNSEELFDYASNYKYVKNIDKDNFEIIINHKFFDEENRFYFIIFAEVEEVEIPLSFLPETNMYRSVITGFVFDESIKDTVKLFIYDIIMEGSNVIKSKKELYKLYKDICDKYNLQIIDNSIGTDYIISLKS